MLRNALRSKAVWALILPVVLVGASFAGADCDKGKTTADAKGSHCNLAKGVSKTAKMTDDGAVVTLAGKNKEAVGHIKEHLGAHQKEEGDCPDCPLSMKGVSASIEMNDDGGTITVKASSPETVKAVQEWASKPAGACCAKGEHGTKA